MPDFTTPAPLGPADTARPVSLADLEPTFGEFFEAQAGNVLRDSPASSIYRMVELAGANAEIAGGTDEFGNYISAASSRRTITAEAAKTQASDAGVTVDFGSARYTPEAVKIMIDRAHRRRARDATISRYQPSAGAQLGISVLASLGDPINVGAAFIPFAGQARYAAFLAQAGSFLGRTGVRAGLGAVEGVGGALLMEPLIAGAATQEGRDYLLADSVRNVIFGGMLGGGLHVAGGTIAEKVFKRTYSGAPIETPADIIDRVPPDMREAGMRAAIADLVEGRPVAAAELMDAFTRDNADAAGRSLSYAESLRKDGPSIDDTMERIGWWERRLAPPEMSAKSMDLRQFIAALGGIRDPGNALRAELGDDIGNLPRGTLITEAGSKRTQRGIEAERVITEAVNQGFVADRAEFIAALRSGGKGFLRKADRQTAEARAADAEHTKRMLAEAGVNPSTRNTLKARAIVGREQQIVASERARQAASVQSFVSRSLGDEPPPKVEPLPEPGSTPLDQMAQPAKPAGKVSDAEALNAETARRLEQIAKWLPPERVAEVKAALDTSRAELEKLPRVLETAAACVLETFKNVK